MVTSEKKCKVCGRTFVGSGMFCTELCKTTGLFVSGGGDTSKPNGVRRQQNRKQGKHKVEMSEEGKSKVEKVLCLPVEERWQWAKNFSEEEAAYARKLSYKMLKEEQVIDYLTDWDGSEEGCEEVGENETIGESDDGTI